MLNFACLFCEILVIPFALEEFSDGFSLKESSILLNVKRYK